MFFKRKTLAFFFGLGMMAVLTMAVLPAAADEFGLDQVAGRAKLKSNQSAPVLLGSVIGAALSLIGVIFLALMIYGGFMWMTAAGKEDKAKKGLDTILAAVIGLIIVFSAYTITNFVFKSAGGGGGSAPQKDEKNIAMSCGAAPGEDNMNELCESIYKAGEGCERKFCVKVDIMDECTGSAGGTVGGFCAQFKTVETCEVAESMQKQFCMWRKK